MALAVVLTFIYVSALIATFSLDLGGAAFKGIVAAYIFKAIASYGNSELYRNRATTADLAILLSFISNND